MTDASVSAGPEELVGRLLEAANGALDLFSVYLGEQLGYYASLDADGPATPAELAARTGTHERYVREWLEQQATTGLLSVEDASAPPGARSYALPTGYELVLVDQESDLFAAPMGRFLAASAGQAENLLAAYRTGGGVSWAQFGNAARTAQADFNRPFYQNHLVQDYLANVPGLAARLSAQGARIAEIGSGGGWASIAMAKAYPGAAVEGFDIDGPSVEMARKNASAAGLDGRVVFHHEDAAKVDGAEGYDLVAAFECIHDMPDPVGALRTMRKMAGPHGCVLVMDEKVGDAFGNVGDFMERLFYGFSIVVCLPDGMSRQPSAGTGTVMRPSTLTGYAKDAGFTTVEILPLEHEMFRIYQLT